LYSPATAASKSVAPAAAPEAEDVDVNDVDDVDAEEEVPGAAATSLTRRCTTLAATRAEVKSPPHTSISGLQPAARGPPTSLAGSVRPMTGLSLPGGCQIGYMEHAGWH
jgi:hypothetical protein